MNTANSTLWVAGFLALASLTACSSTGGYQSDKYRVPDGSQVELTQTLRFPGRSTRTYIQYGETLRRRGDVNEWEPYCSFGLNRSRDGRARTHEVEPTVFTVRGTTIGVDVSSNLEDGDDRGGLIDERGVLVAGVFGGGGGRAGTPALHYYHTTLQLYSDLQPQVSDLTCTFRGSVVDRNLTVDEIRETLDGVVRIY